MGTYSKGEEHMTDVDYRAMYLKVRDELAELQQRKWIGLTDNEVADLRDNTIGLSDLILAVEAKLREKNT